ncbi:MAG: signal peptidase II [Synergistales bacterium]|nr:signal peptidase II [Synergistales bacterium]
MPLFPVSNPEAPPHLSRYQRALLLLPLLADQASKLLASRLLASSSYPASGNALVFALHHNSGAAFSLFHNPDSPLFLAAATAIPLLLVTYLIRTRTGRLPSGLLLLWGGALGNMADRLFRGYVVDFIALNIPWSGFLYFNLADLWIIAGSLALVLPFVLPSPKTWNDTNSERKRHQSDM